MAGFSAKILAFVSGGACWLFAKMPLYGPLRGSQGLLWAGSRKNFFGELQHYSPFSSRIAVCRPHHQHRGGIVGQHQGRKNFCKSSKLLELLSRSPLAQNHEHLVRYLAGPLFRFISPFFRDERAVVYILAEPKRRQVWNAVLATGRHREYDDANQLVEQLVTLPGKTLVSGAYGSCPPGFITLLGLSCETGHPPEFYQFWHDFLGDDDGTRIRQIASSRVPVFELYRVLKALPEPLRTIPIAQRLGESGATLRFVDAVTWIYGGKPSDALWRDVGKKLESGASPRKLLDVMLNNAQCPAPHILDERFRHIATVGELRDAARRFENCLGMDFTVEEALRGETQFYEWRDDGDPCILSIINDMPFGYTVGSIKGVGNVEPDVETYLNITAALAEHGVVERSGVVDMVAAVPRSFGRRRERDVESIFG